MNDAPASHPPRGGPKPEDAGRLLSEVDAVLRRYVVMDGAQRAAVALWVLHTYTFAVEDGELLTASEVTPYLHVMSPAPGCGKSTLFEVLETVVREPKMVSAGITKASLLRSLHLRCPTLLLDEMDLLMRSDKESATAIHQALNAGYRRRGTAEVMATGKGGSGDWQPLSLRVFSPKAFAGIGRLPQTLETRTIPIGLRPKTRDETVHEKWEDVIWAETEALRQKLTHWGGQSRNLLRQMRDVAPPVELQNRTREIWRPLLGIAQLAGGNWPANAREAALALHASTRQALDYRTLILADIRDVFSELRQPRVHTAALLERLVAIEDHPWRGWWLDEQHGGLRKDAAHKLAQLLDPYGIEPERTPFRMNKTQARGYARQAFEAAWQRYLPDHAPVKTVTAVPPRTASGGRGTGVTLVTGGRQHGAPNRRRRRGRGRKPVQRMSS